MLEWMAWTWQTALFFTAIALMLATMTALQLAWPTVPRRGFLPIATTRGDRLFIGLLGAAYIHLAWLGLTDLPLVARVDRGADLVRLRHALGLGVKVISVRGARPSRPGGTAPAARAGRRGWHREVTTVRLSGYSRIMAGAAVGALLAYGGPAIGRHGGGAEVGRQRVPAFDALEGGADEGDGMVHQGGRAVPGHGDQGRLRDHPDARVRVARR